MSAPAADDVLPVHLATIVFPECHPLRGQNGDVMGFAIRHQQGLVLFDTGIGAGNAFIDRYYQPVRRSLAGALADHGHQLSDVTAVINSHLHFDHCGNNRCSLVSRSTRKPASSTSRTARGTPFRTGSTSPARSTD